MHNLQRVLKPPSEQAQQALASGWLTMVSVAGGSIGPLRRRAPSGGKSPSQRAVVSQDIHVPRGSPQQAAATCMACHFSSSTCSNSGDGRRWSWCHLVGACAVLLAVALLVLQSVQPSGPVTSRSRVGSSSHRSASNLARQQRQQQQQQRQEAARAQHVLGEKERETADTNNSIVDKKENQWDYSSRFPRFGTPEHNKACGGREAAPRMETSTKCSVVVQPDPNGTEGLALWASNVVMGYFIHRQIANGGCNLYIDFGAGVDVEAALTTPTAPDSTAEQTSLWSVPPKGFVCRIEDNCHYIWTEPSGSTYRYSYRSSAEVDSAATTAKGRTRRNDKTKNHHLYQQQQQLAPVPFYRFAYNPRYERLKTESFQELGRSLMGRNGDGSEPFNVHTGFACAFSSLFQLSPDAVRYEAKLFTQILPTLQDPDNLVIGVYIRTGATEGKTSANVGYEAIDDAEAHITAAAEILNCALKQERHFASGDKGNGGLLRRKPERIVWMLVTDSNHLKKYISKEYGGKAVVVVGDTADDTTRTRSTIPRDVITTSSAGAHTRPRGGANNNDNDGSIDSQRTETFASAVIDWWLLGESDVSTCT